MTAPLAFSGPDALVLPPAIAGRIVPAPGDAFTDAMDLARRRGADAAGTLVLVDRPDVLDLAVILAPDEPLASARRAFLAGMTALADAVGAHGPPEMPLTFGWPDVLIFDGARLGGGRLGAPDDAVFNESAPDPRAEDRVPDWLVFAAMLTLARPGGEDPGLTPGSTALAEEGFPSDIRNALVESFARNLIRAFADWEADGFAALAGRYLAHLPIPAGVPARIDRNGDCVLGESERWPLAALLREPAWRDPETGTVRP